MFPVWKSLLIYNSKILQTNKNEVIITHLLYCSLTGLFLPQNIALGSSSYLRFLCKNILTHLAHKKLHNINTLWQHNIFIHVTSSEKWVNMKGCLVLQTLKFVTLKVTWHFMWRHLKHISYLPTPQLEM